jgi:hypothetical protein
MIEKTQQTIAESRFLTHKISKSNRYIKLSDSTVIHHKVLVVLKGMKREARIAFGEPMATDGSRKKNNTEIIFSSNFNHSNRLLINK